MIIPVFSFLGEITFIGPKMSAQDRNCDDEITTDLPQCADSCEPCTYLASIRRPSTQALVGNTGLSHSIGFSISARTVVPTVRSDRVGLLKGNQVPSADISPRIRRTIGGGMMTLTTACVPFVSWNDETQVECSPGRFASEPGRSECTECAPGRYICELAKN